MKSFGKFTVDGKKYIVEAEKDTEDWVLHAACVRFRVFVENSNTDPPFPDDVKVILLSGAKIYFRIFKEEEEDL